jgi:RNA polymerase sigma-70 factor (ECF subfamily)
MLESQATVEQADSVRILSDEHVFDRVRAGELALYDVLMQRHHRRLFAIARRIVRNEADAEEVLQQAHLRALTRRHQFAGRSSFVTWVTRIVINEALALLRARVRLPLLDTGVDAGELNDFDFIACRARDPEMEVFRRELSQALVKALGTLPEKYRIVFHLREMESLSVAEAARNLGVSGECVKTRMHRARTLLRQSLRKVVRSSGRRGASRCAWRRAPVSVVVQDLCVQ